MINLDLNQKKNRNKLKKYDAKYLIFGATGSIGSNLANKLYNSKYEFHLVGRNEKELKSLSEKLKVHIYCC